MIKDPWHRNHLIRDAFYSAIHEDMRSRDDLYVIGEGAEVKVAYDCPALAKEFSERFMTLPISEDANVDFGCGLAIGGCRVLVDIISSDFLPRCMDSICNTAAKLSAVGQPRTIVIKAEFMTGGPTSGQRIESLFVGIPGLQVCCPSNPADAHWCMREALNHKGVTVVFEDRMIEDGTTADADKTPPYRQHVVGRPRHVNDWMTYRKRPAVLSYGITLRLLQDWLANADVDLFDMPWLYPIDLDVIEHIATPCTGLLVVEPDIQYSGIGAEIVAHVAEHCPGVKAARMGAPRTGIPACRDQHWRLLPTKEAVLTAISNLTGGDDSATRRAAADYLTRYR